MKLLNLCKDLCKDLFNLCKALNVTMQMGNGGTKDELIHPTD